jgi:hypothetical protein
MSTFSQLTDQTLMQLYGYTTLQDQATYLTASATASATTMTVNDVTAISRGIVEIGDEIIWVDSFDSTTGVLTIPPYGRGFRGTTAAAYAPGVRVVSSPMFPRQMVKQAINDAITAVYPELFAVGETTFNYQPAVSTYSLPAGALDVLQVSWQTTGPSKEWLPVRRMRVDKHAATGSFSTGVSVSIYDSIVPGKQVKIVYTKEPSALVNDSDSFSTVTGLPSSCEDLIRFGAAYRLTPYFDSAHLSGQSAEADYSGQPRNQNNAASLSRFLLQMYQVRLAEETRGLQNLFPVRSHYTR